MNSDLVGNKLFHHNMFGGYMKATATRPTYVVDSGGNRVLLRKGESSDVDGRTYSDGHMFVKAGYLKVDKPEPVPKRKQKAEPESSESDTDVSA